MQIYCKLDSAGQSLLSQAVNQLDLSARAYDRILRVARTIADLENEAHILPEHIGEAVVLPYRQLNSYLSDSCLQNLVNASRLSLI
jgi:magnesium chelatase family protein